MKRRPQILAIVVIVALSAILFAIFVASGGGSTCRRSEISIAGVCVRRR